MAMQICFRCIQLIEKDKHDGGQTSGGFSDFHRDLYNLYIDKQYKTMGIFCFSYTDITVDIKYYKTIHPKINWMWKLEN